MEQRLREQIVRLFGYSVCIVTGFIATHEVLLGTTTLGWSLMAFAISLGAMIQFFMSTRSTDYIAAVFLCSTFIVLAAIVIGSGGRALGANVAIPTFLVLSTMLVKSRTASLVVGMGYLFLLGLAAVLAATSYPFPIQIKPESSATAVYRLPILMSVLAAMVIFPFKSAIIRLNEKYAATLAKEKQAHAVRRIHEERLQDIAHLGGGWFWAVDRNMQIDYLSAGFSHSTGIEFEDAKGKTPEELVILLAGHDGPQRDTAGLAEGRSHSSTDFEFTDSSGALQTVQSAGRPLLGQDGGLLSYYGVARDVTDLREVQSKLRALREVDPETGVASARAVKQALEQAVLSAKTDQLRHAVCILRISDNPAQLQTVAQLLKETVRTQDFVGRTGKSEFCLLLRDYRGECASDIPERLVSAIRSLALGAELPQAAMCAFAGVTMVEHRQIDGPDALALARQACDESQRTGGEVVYVAPKAESSAVS